MKLNLYRSFCFALLALLFTTGCKKEYESIEELDARAVEAYIKQNNLNVQQYNNTGVYYQVISQGTGEAIAYNERIPIVFRVRSLDGSYINTDTIVNHYGGSGKFFGYFTPTALRDAIKDILQKQGGEIKVIVPSHLAYGRTGSGPIPGNASLEYTVKVLNKNNVAAYDEASIVKYMQANSLSGFTKSSEGIYYKIIEIGTGSPITVDSVISAQYTGKLFNGTVFDKTTDAAATFLLSETIDAWRNIVPLIKGGGTIRILTPSAFAYGLEGSVNQFSGGYTIPPFSCLDFEIKVTDVSQ